MNRTSAHKDLRIAMIGTRGVPARYGGFETCVEEVGKRLTKKGHSITVYCRKGYYSQRPRYYRGMSLCFLPNISNKVLDTLSHTFLSVLHALFRRYDVYMVFNAANSIALIPLRLFGKNIVINTDGLEWKRSKWGIVGRSFYKISEKLACILSNRLISDSKGIKEYYLSRHNTESSKIAYGADIQKCEKPDIILEMGLRPFEYFLQITRFEPENNPLLTIEAFKRSNTGKKLVLVGGNPYHTEYVKKINAASYDHDDILLPGFIYDEAVLRELWCFCFAYIHGNEVGGTNPALLQTMACGCFTMSIDVPFNRDVLNGCGKFFQKNVNSLEYEMKWAVTHKSELAPYKAKAIDRISTEYSWDKMAELYEKLFYSVSEGRYPWNPGFL